MAKSYLMCVALIVLFSFCSKVRSTAPTTEHFQTTKFSHSTNVGSCNGSYCDDDDGDDFWLFWLFLIVATLVASLCCGYCCRLRAGRRRRVLILPGERPTTVTHYGTEVVAPIIVAPHPGYNYNQYHNPHGHLQPNLPTYTPVAEHKGEPPPYTYH